MEFTSIYTVCVCDANILPHLTELQITNFNRFTIGFAIDPAIIVCNLYYWQTAKDNVEATHIFSPDILIIWH